MTVPPALAAFYSAEAQLAHRADLAGAVFQLADVAIVEATRQGMSDRRLLSVALEQLAEAQRTIAYERHLRAILRWERRRAARMGGRP